VSKEKETKKNVQEPKEDQRNFLQRIFVRKGTSRTFWVPILAVITALVIGGFFIAFTSPALWETLGRRGVGEALSEAVGLVSRAYAALFQGAFGQPSRMIGSIGQYFETGDTRPVLDAFRPVAESLVISTPYIFAGLAVALGFRGGLFNIGAEGQLYIGGLASVVVGYSITGLPWYIHLPLALLAGILAGFLWGAVPGILKATTGAHEVINTIMMNYIAFRLADYLLLGPMARGDGIPITEDIEPTAVLPVLFPAPMRVHWGFFLALFMAWVVYWFLWKTKYGLEIRMVGANLALFMAWVVYWFLWKTKYGLEIRMVGANPHAARYAGIKIPIMTVMTMAISGALAGLAGTAQVLGVDHRMTQSLSPGYGFDAIALALLGNSHPLGVVLASLLFGFLRGGAARMQSMAGIPVEIIRVVQGMIIIFIAAPEIIRSLYRIKEKRAEDEVLMQSSES
jgi:simple sugar transport system permease protein